MGGYRRVGNERGAPGDGAATRARVATAEGDPALAERHARAGLACAAKVQALLAVPDILECLAGVAADAGGQREAARMFGAAEAIRNRTGLVRFKIYDVGYGRWVATVRNALERDEFDRAWDEGAALSTDEVIAYALRGHTGRKRPASGWPSLTPTERDVVRLVVEGLTSSDVGARLFVRRAPCKPTSPISTPSSVSPPASSSPKKRPATADAVSASR